MPVNGNIAPKSIVIGVADPIPQRGRRNCSPRQRERPAVLPGFLPPACNPTREIHPVQAPACRAGQADEVRRA